MCGLKTTPKTVIYKGEKETMEIHIATAEPADAQQLLEFLQKVGGESDNLSFGEEGIGFSVEEEEAYLSQTESSAESVMLLAKENGKVVGCASLNRLPRRMNHRGEVSISVAKAYEGNGIGSRLLEGILAFARAHSFEIIDLQVRSDNARAIRLYEKYGFQKIGTHPAFFKINGEYVPFDTMYLQVK